MNSGGGSSMAGEATGSFPGRLTALQRSVLAAFFAREREFFLSGGAALAGYHLGHRETLDLGPGAPRVDG
jgi:hypothetical protein